jgi:hypothetical protein
LIFRTEYEIVGIEMPLSGFEMKKIFLVYLFLMFSAAGLCAQDDIEGAVNDDSERSSRPA